MSTQPTEQDTLRKELLKIVEHKTLEENTAVELIMNLIEQHTAKAVREAKHEAVEHYKEYIKSLSPLQRQLNNITQERGK